MEQIYIFFIISRSFLLKQTNVVEKEYQNTYFNFKIYIYIYIYFLFLNAYCYETIWRNIVQPDGPQMTVWSMRLAYWIPKATDAHSEYVTLIAFPQLQWLHERASMLRCRYIACLVLC